MNNVLAPDTPYTGPIDPAPAFLTIAAEHLPYRGLDIIMSGCLRWPWFRYRDPSPKDKSVKDTEVVHECSDGHKSPVTLRKFGWEVFDAQRQAWLGRCHRCGVVCWATPESGKGEAGK